MARSLRPHVLLALVAAWLCHCCTGLLLLSDIPTPAFLVDVQALQRRINTSGKTDAGLSIPPLRLDEDTVLVPFATPTSSNAPRSNSPNRGQPHVFDAAADPYILSTKTRTENDEQEEKSRDRTAIDSLFYLHSTVIQSKDDDSADDAATGLAKLDLPVHCGPAQLVLGLNNHLTVSYYWARSAGAGGSMEAPGVAFRDDQSVLTWQSATAFDCNSNDGKRSEWVNFLRRGDQVQLVPLRDDPATALHEFVKAVADQNSEHTESDVMVYGVSSQARPLGSEPAIVCKWNIERG